MNPQRRSAGTETPSIWRRSYRDSHVGEVLDSLDRELVGLAPVKSRIRDIAALLLIDKLRRAVGLSSGPPALHMSFTGNPGTGKTTVAMRMAEILHRLGYVRKGHLVAVTRDDLVGQYIGHTAPKTREVLKRAMGGVLFIDEAYYLYRPENERDYGQEAIEILLQIMENQRDDLVVILAGYKDRMETFFRSNPGMSSRDRAPHRLSGLHGGGAARDRAADAAADAVPVERAGGRGAARVHREAPGAAALRQRALDAGTRSIGRDCGRRAACSSARAARSPARSSRPLKSPTYGRVECLPRGALSGGDRQP